VVHVRRACGLLASPCIIRKGNGNPTAKVGYRRTFLLFRTSEAMADFQFGFIE
jgi:hypothetical protein